MLIFIKMKKDIERFIEIPEGIISNLEGKNLTIKKNDRELTRKFDFNKVDISILDNKIKISSKKATRRESGIVGTIWAHINNMMKGVDEDFIYKMEICNVHFPMNVKVDGNKVIIKSFLGEITERVAKILPDVNVEVKGNQIIVSSKDIEAAGQTVTNLEKATHLTGRDRRIFQDGIYLINKCGKEI